MKTILTAIVLMGFLFGLLAFNNTFNQSHHMSVSNVIDADEQAALQSEQILLALKEGNLRYYTNNPQKFDYSAQIQSSIEGQFPKAMVLSCIDSRVPVERVFDKGIGDLFVARVAGNLVNEDILGSMEYACKVSGTKVIIVLGHERCGAVKSAIDKVELDNVTNLLSKIQPAIQSASNYKGNHSSKNHTYVSKVSKHNVQQSIEEIKANSPILNEMVANGEIKIVGAMYQMDTGKVVFL